MTRVGIEDSLVTEALKDTKQHFHELYEITAEEPSLRIKKLTNELYHSEPIDWIIEEYNPTMHEMYSAAAIHNCLKHFRFDHNDVHRWSKSGENPGTEGSGLEYARTAFQSLNLTGISMKKFLADLFVQAFMPKQSSSDEDEIDSLLFKSFVDLILFIYDETNLELFHQAKLDAIDVVNLWMRSDEIEFSWDLILAEKELVDSSEAGDIGDFFPLVHKN